MDANNNSSGEENENDVRSSTPGFILIRLISRTMSRERVEQVADAMIALGYDGIVQFDTTEPEYAYMMSTVNEFESEAHLVLLNVLAATQDYQLAGDAQLFWRTLEETVLSQDEIAAEADVNATLNEFMEQPVNARLRSQKKDRLVRMVDNGFGEWFIENYPDAEPLRVWEAIAAALETTKDKKTVVFAMKIYDIFNLVINDEYLNLPVDLPIPCDVQVERVATASGISDTTGKKHVMAAWADVMEQVNAELDRPVSMLRIDSIVWQAGQIISENSDRRAASKGALEKYFEEEVGLTTSDSERLAGELTAALD